MSDEQNAKNPDWKVPMRQEGVHPQDYPQGKKRNVRPVQQHSNKE